MMYIHAWLRSITKFIYNTHGLNFVQNIIAHAWLIFTITLSI